MSTADEPADGYRCGWPRAVRDANHGRRSPVPGRSVLRFLAVRTRFPRPVRKQEPQADGDFPDAGASQAGQGNSQETPVTIPPLFNFPVLPRTQWAEQGAVKAEERAKLDTHTVAGSRRWGLQSHPSRYPVKLNPSSTSPSCSVVSGEAADTS